MTFFARMRTALRWLCRPAADLTPREQDQRNRAAAMEAEAARLKSQNEDLAATVKVQKLEIQLLTEVNGRDRARVQAEAAIETSRMVKAEKAAGER